MSEEKVSQVMNLLTQVDHRRLPLRVAYWITENCLITLSDPKSRYW